MCELERRQNEKCTAGVITDTLCNTNLQKQAGSFSLSVYVILQQAI